MRRVQEPLRREAFRMRERFGVMKYCPGEWFVVCLLLDVSRQNPLPCIPYDGCTCRDKVAVVFIIIGGHMRESCVGEHKS